MELLPDRVLEILRAGQFDGLIGEFEHEALECKASPYQLNNDSGKMELAKDVSALANAHGGLLLIGVATRKHPESRGDQIESTSPFAQKLVDCEQYEKVISDWIYPPIPGFSIRWYPCSNNRLMGIVGIHIPPGCREDRPYLTCKLVDTDGRTCGAYVGYFQRTGDRVPPMTPMQLRDRLKDGFRNTEIDGHLQNFESLLQNRLTEQQKQPSTFTPQAIRDTVMASRKSVDLSGKPTFFLAAWPDVPVDFTDLFRGRRAEIVRILDNPPLLRADGFDLTTGQPSQIVSGKLRRSVIPGFMSLELWKSGPLIFLADGGVDYLCWVTGTTQKGSLIINNTVLFESAYLFCSLALSVFKYCQPQNPPITVGLGFVGMTMNGAPCVLTTNIPGPYAQSLGRGGQADPEGLGNHMVCCDIPENNPDIGRLSFMLLKELFAFFGFEEESIPYADWKSGQGRIATGIFPAGDSTPR